MDSTTHHVATLAGAGTGKTHSLVENYVQALFGLDPSGVKKRPHEILALTFTTKAAHEMRIRIAERLMHVEPASHDIKMLLRALPNAAIATFHSFCLRCLRDQPTAFAIDDAFTLLSAREESELFKNVLRPVIMERITHGDVRVMELVARFRLGKGLMSLGLIDGLFRVYETIKERGVTLGDLAGACTLAHLAKEEIIGSYHQAKIALAAFTGLKLSETAKAKVSHVHEALQGLAAPLGSFHEDALLSAFLQLKEAAKGSFGPHDARKNLMTAIDRLGAKLVDYFGIGDEQAVIELLTECDASFRNAKERMQALSFSDLLIIMRDGLIRDLSLRNKLKMRFSHILVDEYQDTSPVQEDIIALLAESKTDVGATDVPRRALEQVDLSLGSSLFVVGDKKQSIYGFRGADASLFDRMIDKMAQGDQFSPTALTVNRRSRERVLALINLVAKATLCDQGYRDDHDLIPLTCDGGGKAGLWVCDDVPGKDLSHKNAKTAAFGVFELLQHGDIAPKDIVILVRRIKMAGVIKSELSQLRIPSVVINGDGFYEQTEIADIICALKLVVEPTNRFALSVVLRSPLVLLTDAEMLTLWEHQKLSLAVLEAKLHDESLSPRSQARLQKFLSALKTIQENLFAHDLAWAVDLLLAQCDLPYALGLRDDNDQAWANVAKLKNLAAKDSGNPYEAIERFYQRLRALEPESLGALSTQGNAVTIMTIHQSKGLEFPVVVLADGESSLPHHGGDFLIDPDLGLSVRPKGRPIASCVPKGDTALDAKTKFLKSQSRQAKKESDEQKRLLYVALTRSKNEIYVVASPEGYRAPKPATLLGLFLRGRHHNEVIFDELCPLEKIAHPKLTWGNDHDEHQGTLRVFSPPQAVRRVFASMLKADEGFPINTLRPMAVVKTGARINGDFAHKVLATAGEMMVAMNHLDDGMLDLLISSAARSLPKAMDDQSATLKAVQETLKVLWHEFASSQSVIFEMPLRVRVNDVMIEGFADLVLEYDTWVGVIDFKSSAGLVKHPNTYVQLFAYAQALKQQSSKPVRLAPMLIGSKAPLVWQDYGQAAHDYMITLLGRDVHDITTTGSPHSN